MPQDETKSESSQLRDVTNAESEPTLPPAWQPLTPRGVAAFARATIGRLMLVQFIVALLVTASLLWFLSTTWFPTLLSAIRQLPDSGQIQDGELSSPRTSTAPLAETRLLAVLMDLESAGLPAVNADLRVELHRSGYAFCSLLGCLTFKYPRDRVVPFSQLELESFWAAWRPTIYTVIGLGSMLWLFVTWFSLASIYAPVVRIYAFFKDRQLSVAGSWRLSAAALLPAALMMAGGIVLYGLGLIDLIGFLVLFVLHLVVGWAYLFVSPLRLPRASDALAPPRRNPFDLPTESPVDNSPASSPNPFAGPASADPPKPPEAS